MGINTKLFKLVVSHTQKVMATTMKNLSTITKHQRRAVSNPALYSQGTGYECWMRDRDFLWLSAVRLDKCQDSILNYLFINSSTI